MIVGIALGLFILGALTAFSLGLPNGAEADEPVEPVALALPDTLPGGYGAADLPASFEDGELAEQADAIAKQQADSTAYGNEVLPDVLGTSAVTRSYVVNGTQAVFVQVFQADGGAFAPSSLTDPETTDGAGGITMKNVGDGVCILTIGQIQPGQAAADVPTSSECQVSSDGLTVQLSSDDITAGDLVDLADEILAVVVQP